MSMLLNCHCERRETNSTYRFSIAVKEYSKEITSLLQGALGTPRNDNSLIFWTAHTKIFFV
jgi:hypothetical protein